MYQDLMSYWDEKYPDRIYKCNYDLLTANQDKVTRDLIYNLGLSWENVCLSPHLNMRRVKTASQQQVKKKMYKGSSMAWKKFEPYLNGAFDDLKSLH